ncbi:MAG: ComEA family DNA-binding protein [Desulfosudaceae bacterium]
MKKMFCVAFLCVAVMIMGAGLAVSADQSQQADSGKININTATAEELTALNGIGQVYAARIVAYRQTHGKFTSLDELKNIKGIGDQTIEKNRDRMMVGRTSSP